MRIDSGTSMRLAWFSPVPPIRSGIAQYSQELLPVLSSLHAIDLFVDGHPRGFATPDPQVGLYDAHDFVWLHRRAPYDLVVYQLGNAPCHDHMWPYLVRYPGLVVLHDGQLHHARARALLQQRRYDDYRKEFRFNHPDAPADVAELGVEGLLGSLTYRWPMLRAVVESSRLVVVHNQWLAEQVREAHPGTRIHVVDMGVPDASPRAGAREAVRARHGIPADAVLFLALGKVTPEKRLREALDALAAIGEAVPAARLLIAGETVDYYDPIAAARALGIDNRVIVAGFVADEEIDDYLAAADVCLCMRWPSSRETSASWLRCLAAGRPTITTDLVHTADVPALDPRSWAVLQGEGREPVTVSIDILDEDHSLRLAMRRLAADERLRSVLGRNAHALWHERWRLDQMAAGYRQAIDIALAAPHPDRDHLPTHFLQDGTGYAERLLREAGLSDALKSDLWIGHTA